MEINYRQKVFIQINLALENSKSGFSKTQFLNNWHHLKLLPGLEIVGLMTMPPLNNTTENASENRKYFKELKEIGQSLGLSEFSMGTSQDYLIALEEGATWIRIGTLLFGERERLINNESRSQ